MCPDVKSFICKGNIVLIIYNWCYDFEGTWSKTSQKVIFKHGFRRVQSPTCTIYRGHHLKKKMAVQTPWSCIITKLFFVCRGICVVQIFYFNRFWNTWSYLRFQLQFWLFFERVIYGEFLSITSISLFW